MINFESRKIIWGFIIGFLGTSLFSLKSIFIKLAYEEGLNTDSVLMLRMAISLPIFLLVILYLYKKESINKVAIKSHIPSILFLGFIGYFLASWLNLKGLESISASLERVTLFTYPVFVAILGALFFKTPLTKRIIFSLSLSYLGIWIVFSKELEIYSEDVTLGLILVILSAISYALYLLLSKNIIQQIGSTWFTALAMSVSSLFVLTYYAIFLDWFTIILNLTYKAWLWTICLALFSTIIPHFLISEAIAKIGPARTGIVGMSGPVLTIILAISILNEPFHSSYFWGILLVISGISLLTLQKPQSKIHHIK